MEPASEAQPVLVGPVLAAGEPHDQADEVDNEVRDHLLAAPESGGEAVAGLADDSGYLKHSCVLV